MPRIDRRKLLKLSGAGTLAAARRARRHSRFRASACLRPGHDAALAEIRRLRAGLRSAPARARSRTSARRRSASTLSIETINGDGMQARITSAIQSKSGPDIMMAASNWAQLYADSLVDVSDIADEVGKAQGGYFQTARDIANDGKSWIAMPFTILGVLFANRTSWFADVGITSRQIPEDLGRISRHRQADEGQEPPATARRWPMPSVTGRRSGIPICGPGAARRSRPTARPSC